LRQSFHSTTTITTNNQQTSWQRSAKLVKKDPTDATSTETTKHLHYLDTIRASHDPSLHIKTLEDELMGTMGAALGKQAEKIKYYLQQMEIQKNIYTTLVREQGSEHILIQETAIRYNEFRKMAKQARWELLVHRQAVGFIVNNHNVVHETFPIGEPLPMNPNEKPVVKEEFTKYGDQRDWWERVGRWK